MIKIIRLLGLCLVFGAVLWSCSCSKSPTDDGGGGGGPEPEPPWRYFSYPAWHPGGEWIAVQHADSLDTDGDEKKDQIFFGIWLIHAQTAEKQPLLEGFALPAWNTDGTKLAMVGGAQIFTIDVQNLEPAQIDSSSLQQLTFEGHNFSPAWSPDGQWIVYDSNVNDPSGANVIWKMHQDGSQKTDISQHGVGEWRTPDWSPDGRSIVHQNFHSYGGGEIAIIDSDGQNLCLLTRDGKRDSSPRYSPDGSQIAFHSQSAGHPGVIWVMNADGSDLHQVSPEGVYEFDWSPDGQQFVFSYVNHQDLDDPGNGQLWLINADGSGLRQLTDFGYPDSFVAAKTAVFQQF